MELNNNEAQLVKSYLYRKIESLPDEILDKIEIGVWIFQPLPIHMFFFPGPASEPKDLNGGPLFLSGRFGAQASYETLVLFREKLIPYLMIRVNSWECYINCNGEILSEHCEEDLDSVREACERLRERCGDGHPSVRTSD